MNDLANQNPLMHPIEYNGRTYFTSQYFHAQYKGNLGAKYASLSNFNKLIRSMETYDDYIDGYNVVHLKWGAVKDSGNPQWSPLFESNTYNPILLLDATAQIALTHHLDDETSKKASVTVNSRAASAGDSTSLPYDRMASSFEAFHKVALIVGLEGNQALLTADKGVRNAYGAALLPLLEIQLASPVQARLLTPTEIGKELGGLSPQTVNKLLQSNGLQERNASKIWVPTTKGREYSQLLDVNKDYSNGTPVQQLKWFDTVIDLIK